MFAVVVFKVGRQCETYIARHIDGLFPKRTLVCSLAECEAPQWSPGVPEMKLWSSTNRPVRVARRIASLMPRGWPWRFDMARLAVWLKRHHVQVVFCEYLQVALVIADLCRRMRIPVIAHAHGYDVAAQPRDPRWAQKYRDELPHLDDIVVVSRAMKEKVLEFGVRADRVHVVPCGTALSVSSSARAHTNKPVSTVVAVGRLVGKKGPLFLLESFRRVRDAGMRSELFVVGDGPFREPLEQFVRAIGAGDCVHLLGERPNHEVRELLSRADVFLQHSVTAADGDEEGLPVSILEALAESVPIVSTLHAGIPEIVRDGEHGFLVQSGDCQGMADRLAQLLMDADLRSRMGAAGRATVVERFTLDNELDQLREIVRRRAPRGLE